jgi:tetratricopeptide (TPR) repeat protein
MTRYLGKAWPGALVAALLVAAAPARDGEALLREAAAAFERGDYASAVNLYEQAEVRTTDPGLVAFDLATAKYRLALAGEGGRTALLQQAEQLYRCCLERDDPRRVRALLGVGNCRLLLRDGKEGLQAAAECYEQCLKVAGPDSDLATDARHNLELARLLLLQAPAGNPSDNKPPEGDPSTPRPPDKPPAHQPQPAPALEPGAGKTKPEAGKPTKPEEGPAPTSTGDTSPGSGNLRSIPDRADAPPLSPQEAGEHLEQATERIVTERRAHRQRSARTPPPNVRDW